jgi:hypothetical protein
VPNYYPELEIQNPLLYKCTKLPLKALNSKIQVQDSDLAHFLEDGAEVKKFLRLSNLFLGTT